MKTRNEIYQGEGAQLLRFITTYHSLQYEQVLRLFSKKQRVYQISDHKSGKTKSALSMIRRTGFSATARNLQTILIMA